MLIRHDTEANATYVTLLPEKAEMGAAARTKKIHPWLLVDYDAAGNMFGIEILDASAHSVEDVFSEIFDDSDLVGEFDPTSVRGLKI